jgi:integrase
MQTRMEKNVAKKQAQEAWRLGSTRSAKLKPCKGRSFQKPYVESRFLSLICWNWLLITGMRMSEQCGLQWNCVDLDRRQITTRGANTAASGTFLWTIRLGQPCSFSDRAATAKEQSC